MEALSIAHQALLQTRLKQAGTNLSEYSFANLYLFRHVHDYRVLQDKEDIYITGRTYEGSRFVMPAFDIRFQGLRNLPQLVRDHDFIFPVPEEWLSGFGPSGSRAVFHENDSDYVYAAEKLFTYKGQKLHGQKNLLNQFLALYTPQPRPLTMGLMPDAVNILEVWQRDVGEPPEQTDYDPCREAFELYEGLNLCGGIYYVNDEPAGFIIGEELQPDCFAFHFAKGKKKFKGLYQYMYSHFVATLPQQYAWVNFEQDLGKLALKIAKKSYHPDRMLNKYRVKI